MTLYYAQCDQNDDGCSTKYPGDLDNCPKCGGATALMAIPALLPVDCYVYDIETYPNIFTLAIEHPATGTRWMFEISDRKNDYDSMVQLLHQLRSCNARMIGYNNEHFDYPVIHEIIERCNLSVNNIYDKAMSIIKGKDQWTNRIWPDDRYIEQVDLFKIRHFDNMAKSTSLKSLEFAMRMKNIKDLPFPVSTILNDNQKDELIFYNWHDIKATIYFWVRTLDQIAFRDTLSKKYNKSFTNHNDTKIGKDYFIMRLEQMGIQCFENRQPRQTIRPLIKLSEVVFHYIKFEHPEFNRISNHFKSTTITETKGVFKELTATIDGLSYVFGSGGLHASIERQLVSSDDTHQLIDVDVASYYPNLAIKNRLFPAHLGDVFCDIYEDVFNQRRTHAKGTPENAMLKLALNGVYGDSNNIYSPFYDPFYTMSITINGQLLLCMLVDQLIKIPGLTMVQCNTDGVTYRCPHDHVEHSRSICKWWENFTKLELEESIYSRFWIRDVNNYIAEYDGSGELKRKGAYEYKLEWHQNASSLIIPKAVEQHLVNGVDVREFIINHKDSFDFMIRAKVPRSNQLVMRFPDLNVDLPMQSLTRYFISKSGGSLIKIAPARGVPGQFKRANKLTDQYFDQVMKEIGPGVWDERIHTKNKSVYTDDIETGISVGWLTTNCNDADKFDWKNLNYDYYIEQVMKLII